MEWKYLQAPGKWSDIRHVSQSDWGFRHSRPIVPKCYIRGQEFALPIHLTTQASLINNPINNMKFFAIALGLLVASVSVSAAALDTRAAEATDPFTACDGLLQGESCIWTLDGFIFTGGQYNNPSRLWLFLMFLLLISRLHQHRRRCFAVWIVNNPLSRLVSPASLVRIRM